MSESFGTIAYNICRQRPFIIWIISGTPKLAFYALHRNVCALAHEHTLYKAFRMILYKFVSLFVCFKVKGVQNHFCDLLSAFSPLHSPSNLSFPLQFIPKLSQVIGFQQKQKRMFRITFQGLTKSSCIYASAPLYRPQGLPQAKPWILVEKNISWESGQPRSKPTFTNFCL